MTPMLLRRRFLLGTGGSLLALPLLESALHQTARGAAPVPKRLLIVTHEQGRLIGRNTASELWSPGTSSGPLPPAGTAPSPMLAALAPIRDEIVTVDGIDNLLRHVSTMEDGHIPALVSSLSCSPQAGEEWRPGEASLDYAAGTRLRSGPEMRASVVVPASATPFEAASYADLHCFGPGGTDATVISGNPEEAVVDLFGPAAMTAPEADPQPKTFRERLVEQRSSLLDGVSESLAALRHRVSSRDRERLDFHAEFISAARAKFRGGTAFTPSATCLRPDETGMPHVVPSNYDEWLQYGQSVDWARGRSDDITWPYQLENLVQAFACDVVRVAVLSNATDPTFQSEFPSGSPFEADQELHNVVHGLQEPGPDSQAARDVNTGFQLWARKFTQVVQRLSEIQDVDGSRLLDNTLVVWVSEMGYGSDHLASNIPIVLAGMRGAFSQGQGRHVVENRRTMGDLGAQVLRMLGGDDTTFGSTGTLGEVADAHGVSNLRADAGHPGYIQRDTPLHTGELDL